MRTLARLLFHNWHLKLLALLIAFLLWSAYTAEPHAEIGYLVPLEFRGAERVEIVGDVPTQVHVRLRGRSALLRRLAPADLTISIDLSGSAPGEQLIHLSAAQIAAPAGVEVVRVAPAEFTLRLVSRPLPR